ncbi:MAG: hypothetical protein FWF57_01825 [Defluviitaleaceae bacterium]|nr:hypothetical protein [Defluviitaleaceae bacterium]
MKLKKYVEHLQKLLEEQGNVDCYYSVYDYDYDRYAMSKIYGVHTIKYVDSEELQRLKDDIGSVSYIIDDEEDYKKHKEDWPDDELKPFEKLSKVFILS